MSRPRRFTTMVILLSALTCAVAAQADDGPQRYVETQQKALIGLLKQPASPAREAQLSSTLDNMIDYDELVRRSFGQPCSPQIPKCTNHWAELTPAQQAEARDLLGKIVSKNYRKNLVKVVDFDLSYKGVNKAGGDTRVKTEAKNRVKPRDPVVQVDYIVASSGGGYKTVDIYTENSSLAKNYYDQFHKMMTTPSQGYPYVAQKLRSKLAKM